MLGFSDAAWGKSGLVREDEDLEDEKSEADENESEDLTTLESNSESLVGANIAKVSGLDVGDGGNDHADITTEHGGGGTDDEGDHGVRELSVSGPRHVNSTKDDAGKEKAE